MFPNPHSPARILLVDDQPIVRLGLCQLIGGEPGLTIGGDADSADMALELESTARPDLAILDLSTRQGTGLDLIRLLHERAPTLPILVFSTHDEALFAERALRAGARGYIMKREPTALVLRAIHQVLAGEIYLSERMSQHVFEHLRHDAPSPTGRLAHLTDRELEVLELIGLGGNTTSIASRLGISVKTVETYRSNLKTKLHLRDSGDLIRYAATWTERA